MSAFKSIVPIQQQQFNPVAGPVTGYITPVDMTGMEANSVIQLAKSLSDISPALRNLAGSYLKEDISAAQQAGEAMDFTGLKLSASPEENEKQFRDFVQKNNAPLAANPYFLIAARASYGRRMAQDYEGEIRAQKDSLTAPFNAVNYDQVAQASRQKFIEQMGNNFYAVNAFNDAANQSDSRLRRYYFEEQSKKAEEFHKDQVATEAGNLLSSLITPGVDSAVLGQVSELVHREITMKGLDGKEFLRKSVYGLLQNPNLSHDDIDNLMVDLHEVNLGTAPVGSDAVLWSDLQGMAKAAKNRIADNNAFETKRIQNEAERIMVKDAGELGWSETLRNYSDMGSPEAAVPLILGQLKERNPNVGPATWDRVRESMMDQALSAKKQKYEAESLSQEAVNRVSANTLTDLENRLFRDPSDKATPEEMASLTPKDLQLYLNKRSSNDTYDYFKAQVTREPLMVTLYPALGIDPSLAGSQTEIQQLNVEWLDYIGAQRKPIIEKALDIQNFEQRKDYIQQTVGTAFETWKKSKIDAKQKSDIEAQRPTSLVSNNPRDLMGSVPAPEQGFAGQQEGTQATMKAIMEQGGKSRIPQDQYQTLVGRAAGASYSQAYDTLDKIGFTRLRSQGRTLLRDPKELAEFIADPARDFYEVKGKFWDAPMNKPQAMFLYSKIRTAFGYSYGDYEAKAQGKGDLYGMPFPDALSPFRTSMVSSAAELNKMKQGGFALASRAFPSDIKTERDFLEMMNYQEVLLDIQLRGVSPKDGSKPQVTEGNYGTGIPFINW